MCDPTFLERYRTVTTARTIASTLNDLIGDLRRQELHAAARFIEQTSLPKARARLDAEDQRFLVGAEPSPSDSSLVVRQAALPTAEQR